MPSLRDRSKRPSYALLAEGLDNLSDDDRDSDASHAEGSQAGARRRAKSQSSESTDFNPAVKGKGKGKGKAESGSEFEGASSEEEEEDDMEDDAVDEVEQEEEDDKPEELDEDDELVALDSPPAKAPPRPRPPPIFTNAASHSNQATYITSDTNLIPLHYRQLIVKHSEIIAAPIRGKPTVASKERDYKARSLDPIAMPHGPGTPFVTRLKKEVKGREAAEVIYDQELGRDPVEAQDKYKRQRHSANVVKNVTLTAPWEVWQGEGWWPEMAPGHPVSSRFLNSDGKGAAAGVPAPKPKGIPKTAEGWTMRADVRLGSDDVGRYSIGQMEFLSKEQALIYMPQTLDVNGKSHTTFNVGLHDQQTKHDVNALDAFPLNRFNPAKTGFAFSAGGPIWGLDWCPFPDSKADRHEHTQYLAVSTMPNIDAKAAIGEKMAPETPGSIQIWAALPPIFDNQDNMLVEGRMSCEVVLCTQGGPVVDLKWMPMGAWDNDSEGDLLPKLGIIAACHLDGSVSFYPVPQPRVLRENANAAEGGPLYWRVDRPLLKLEIPDAMCSCIDWLNGGKIVCGTSTGFIAIWDVLESLRNPDLGPPLPAMYISAAQSFIKSIAVGRDPPENAKSVTDYTRDPVYIVCGSHDATVTVVDLRDREQHYEIARTRMPNMAVGWSNQLGCPIWADSDYTPQLHDPRGRFHTRSYNFAHHRGPVWDVATSDYHTMALSCSTDGSVLLSNLQPGWFRRRAGGMIYQRLFEMDYDEFTGEYRILDDFLPEEMTLDGAMQKNANKAKGSGHSLEGNPTVAKSGDWSPHVAVHRVCWNNNNGLGRAGWIASGTASGLGRIDIIRGRFLKGKTPAGMGP